MSDGARISRAKKNAPLKKRSPSAREKQQSAPGHFARLGPFYRAGPTVAAPPALQMKLVVGPADDAYEQEADAVAARVTAGQSAPPISPLPPGGAGPAQRQPADEAEPEEESPVQRQPAEEETEEEAEQSAPVQRQEEEEGEKEELLQASSPRPISGPRAISAATSRAVVNPGPGEPLPRPTQHTLESHLQTDLRHVRLHRDGRAQRAAADLKARAFTHQNHIWLRAGESPDDVGLMAHEATHVVQQNGGGGVVRRSTSEAEPLGRCPTCGRLGTGTCPDCGVPFIPLQRQALPGVIQLLREPDCTPEEGAAAQAEQVKVEATEEQGETAPAKQREDAATEEQVEDEQGQNGEPAAETVAEEPIEDLAEEPAALTEEATAAPTAASSAAEQPSAAQRAPAEVSAADEETEEVEEEAEEEVVLPVPAIDSGPFPQMASEEAGPQREATPTAAEPESIPERTVATDEAQAETPTSEATQRPAAEEAVEEAGADRDRKIAKAATGALAVEEPATESSGGDVAGDESRNSAAEAMAAEDAAGAQEGVQAEAAKVAAPGDKEGESPAATEGQKLDAESAEAASAGVGIDGLAMAGAGECTQQAAMVTASRAALQAVDERAAALVGAPVHFAAVPTAETEAPPALMAERQVQREQATSLATNFLARAADRIRNLTTLGLTAPDQIQAASDSAQAQIAETVTSQSEAVSNRVAETQAQARRGAASARRHIDRQYKTAVAAIKSDTQAKRKTLKQKYDTALKDLTQQAKEQHKDIDKRYADIKLAFHDAGARVGKDAAAEGETRARGHERKITGKRDSLTAGYLTDRRMKARAKAARAVGDAYKDGLIEEADKQAEEAMKGREKDHNTVNTTVEESRKSLAGHYDTAVKALENAQEKSLQDAEKAKHDLRKATNKTLATTLKNLTKQKADNQTALAEVGQQKQAAVESGSLQSIAGLQTNVVQPAQGLLDQLDAFRSMLAGIEPPHPEQMQDLLGETLGDLQAGLGQLEGINQQATGAAATQLSQAGSETVTALGTIAQQAMDGATATGDGFGQSMAEQRKGATQTFKQLSESHKAKTTAANDAAIAGFDEVKSGIDAAFKQINDALTATFEQGPKRIEEALRGAFPDMRTAMQEEEEKAAAKEQPAWKGIVKWVLIIAIVVVVALVIGPFVIGAVGAALGSTAAGVIVGGAIVGAATSASIQVVNNWAAGEDLMKGVVKAAVIGAVGGALGGAAGLAVQRVGSVVGRFALETVADVAVDTGINVATGEFSWDNIGMSLITSVGGNLFTSGLGATRRGARIQESFQTSGAALGGRVRVAAPDVPTPRAPEVDTAAPAGPRVEPETPTTPRPETSAEAPSAPRPETEAEAPTPRPDAESEVAVPPRPETETEAPTTRPEAEAEPPAPRPDAEPEAAAPPRAQTEAEAKPSSRLDPEAESNVVARTTTGDGHEIKILKNGEIVQCTECIKILDEYINELDARPDLEQKLYEINKEADPTIKADKTKDLIAKLKEHRSERQRILGEDPKKGHNAHEAEVGALIERDYGGFKRDPTGDGEWISTGGAYKGQTFDLVGIPPGKSGFHSDAMERFLPSVDAHFRKSIDNVVLDTRYMRPQQKKAVLDYIDKNWSSEKHRLIIL